MALTRIRRFVEASIHEGLDYLEEPVMMVKQYMRDMKSEMTKAEEAIDKQERLHQRLTKDLQLAKGLMTRREEQARLAIEAGEDELARRALQSKKQAYEQIQRYESLLEMSDNKLLEQRAQLEQLQVKYAALRDKKLELILRVQATKASEQMKKMKAKNMTRSIEEGFERMEDRVLDMEFRTRSTSIDNWKDAQKTYSTEIEEELLTLKRQHEQKEEGKRE